MSGFFAPYAHLGIIVLGVFLLISLFSGILLGRIIGRKLTVLWTFLISCVLFYFLDLDYSFSIIVIFAIAVTYVYFIKKH